MASSKKSSRNDKSSIKYQWIPLNVTSFDSADIGHGKDIQAHHKSPSKSNAKSETSSSNKIVSTAELISAVGELWKVVSLPSSIPQPKLSVEGDGNCHKEDAVRYPFSEGDHGSSVSVLADCLSFDSKSSSCFLPTAKSDYEFLKSMKKMILFESCKDYVNNSLVWRHAMASDSPLPIDSRMREGLTSAGDSINLSTTYENLSGKPFVHLRDRLCFAMSGGKRVTDNCIFGKMTPAAGLPAAEEVDHNISLTKYGEPSDGETMANRSAECNATLGEYGDSSDADSRNLVENAQHSSNSLCSASSVSPATNLLKRIAASNSPSLGLYSDCNIELSASIDCSYEELEQSFNTDSTVVESSENLSASKDNDAYESGKNPPIKLVFDDKISSKLWLSLQDKLENAFARKEHALAGALAGTVVSLCLHPVDTVKTVIQAHSMHQKSILQTIESIISEKGIMGLYRGLSSNIVSSAPISAVYTFTYESVKVALLPLLPKEYHSLVHCAAGGCASIATSFIFTPSECIKQQMQVHSHYQNCWNALIGVLEKGGLPSLYAGWGAVLCRNIPHSIIKFYTYESLKQLLQVSTQPDARPNSTLQTLVCGGLAGSTAALFTTPFDVVKTRLQTQVPGALRQNDGVLHVLKEIAKHEGIKGLYRGLTPRLAVYVSQGAIFFATYEFFKTVFSLEDSEVRNMSKRHREQTT